LQGGVQNSRLESVIEDGLYGVAVSSDGSLLATPAADKDTEVIVWDPVSGEKLRTLAGPPAVFAVEFSPTGTLLAVSHTPTTGDEGFITVWDAATGDEVARLAAGDPWPVPHWSPDSSLLIAVGRGGGQDRPVTVWRSPSMNQVNSFQIPGASSSERFLDPITLAVARPGDDRISFYDVTTGDEVENGVRPGRRIRDHDPGRAPRRGERRRLRRHP
jgi:WD40 repeat protein